MQAGLTGPVAAEITKRLTEALRPTQLQVIDDSEKHRGHGGYNPNGGETFAAIRESHFTVEIESPAFTGLSRVQRQRAVNDALRDLLVERVHALAIKARAPGE
jgi:BolA family transcriptional regulator, general stress-responsive regulator